MLRDTPEIEVASIRKNSSDEVRLRLNEYRGSHFLDIRVFSQWGSNPEPVATKKGVALDVSRIDDLLAALALAKSEAVRLGLLGPDHTGKKQGGAE